MNDIFKLQIDTTPRIYFAPEVCALLNHLDEVSELFCGSVTAANEDLAEDCSQLKSSEVWGDFFDIAEEIRDFWGDINPANRPYDFGWCQAHLALHTMAKSLKFFVDLNPDDCYVGDVSLFAADSSANRTEVLCQFRSLTNILDKVESVFRSTTGMAMPSLFDTFEP